MGRITKSKHIHPQRDVSRPQPEIPHYVVEMELPPCCGLRPVVFRWADRAIRHLFGVECQNPSCPHDNHVHAVLLHGGVDETERSDYLERWERFRVKN